MIDINHPFSVYYDKFYLIIFFILIGIGVLKQEEISFMSAL